ncbi:hypothetical protein SARC_16832, partial [Sphaeroforma arctica JP610]
MCVILCTEALISLSLPPPAPDKVEKVDVNKEAVLRALSDFMTELVSNLSTLLACSSATQKTAYPSTVSDLVSLVDEFGTYLSPRI